MPQLIRISQNNIQRHIEACRNNRGEMGNMVNTSRAALLLDDGGGVTVTTTSQQQTQQQQQTVSNTDRVVEKIKAMGNHAVGFLHLSPSPSTTELILKANVS